MSVAWALAGLFWSALLAATVLPGASELLLVGMLVEKVADPATLVAVAGIGNTLGSAVNWVCGRFLVVYRDRRWFPVPARELDRYANLFNHFGLWSLLFAWSPIGGDALTVIAGALRVPFGRFVLLVAIGKFARYAVVAAATLGWTG